MERLWIHPSETEAFAALGIGAFDAVITHLAVELPPGGQRGVFVTPTSLQLPDRTCDVYFKYYNERPGSLRFLGRASKARGEVRSYQAFDRLGIRCPQWIACGERRDRIGRLRSAFIITATVPESMMLDEFLAQRCTDPTNASSRAMRQEIIAQLADAARTAHRASFFHNDLHWRNILVNCSDTSPQVWWIDCPRGRFLRWSPMKRHYRVKDLACLDRGALSHCTRSERMRFIQHYLQCSGSRARRLARDVEAYRNRRW